LVLLILLMLILFHIPRTPLFFWRKYRFLWTTCSCSLELNDSHILTDSLYVLGRLSEFPWFIVTAEMNFYVSVPKMTWSVAAYVCDVQFYVHHFKLFTTNFLQSCLQWQLCNDITYMFWEITEKILSWQWMLADYRNFSISHSYLEFNSTRKMKQQPTRLTEQERQARRQHQIGIQNWNLKSFTQQKQIFFLRFGQGNTRLPKFNCSSCEWCYPSWTSCKPPKKKSLSFFFFLARALGKKVFSLPSFFVQI